MSLAYLTDEHYDSFNFSENFPVAEYDSCTFTGCNFTAANLSGSTFHDCEFKDCDLSNAITSGTTFSEVFFLNCKLMGVRFDECNPFLLSFHFEESILNFASFYKLKLKNIRFLNCKLEEVDFTEADLRHSLFRNCDLTGATFSNTKLEKADLVLSKGFSIDPTANRIFKAKFSATNIRGLLDTFSITIE